MALMACGDKTQSAIMEKGYITMCEPTCGSGVMVTSFLKAMQKEGLNYCTQLVVTAVDVDAKCAHMTYLQLALYGVPAVVIHGDSLAVKEFSRWYTPVYLLNGWVWREHCGITTAFCVEDEMIKRALEPTYAAIRQVEALMADTASNSGTEPPKDAILASEVTKPVENEQIHFDTGFEVLTPAPTAPKSKKSKPAPQPDGQISLFEV
jgi:hypothetical protein